MSATYSFCDNTGTVIAAGKVWLDLFNAAGSGKVIRLAMVEFYHRNTGNVNGQTMAVEVWRTTSVGTGGSVLTADKLDTADATLPAQVTCRSFPTGGAATTGLPVAAGNVNTDETSQQPQLPFYDNDGSSLRRQLTLREGEGVVLIQGPFGTVGKAACRLEITVE